MSGWIKLHRTLLEWEWMSDTNTFQTFIYCLLRANFEDKTWRGIEIKRGSFYTSLDTISNETGLSVRQIRTSLDKLQMTGELTGSKMPRGRIITVLNYDKYQEVDRLSVSEKAGSRQALDRLVTTNKNNKNIINKNIVRDCGDNPDHQENPSRPQSNKFSDDDMTTAEWMFKLIQTAVPKTKKPNFDKWANTIRIMVSRDKLTHKEICEVFRWANNDPFWRVNILSPDKLRKQYPQLEAKMKTSNVQPINTPDTRAPGI